VPLVVTAKKTAFRAPVVDEQQQMPVGPIGAEKLHLSRVRHGQDEELVLRPAPDVDRDGLSFHEHRLHADPREMALDERFVIHFFTSFLKRLGDCAGEAGSTRPTSRKRQSL